MPTYSSTLGRSVPRSITHNQFPLLQRHPPSCWWKRDFSGIIVHLPGYSHSRGIECHFNLVGQEAGNDTISSKGGAAVRTERLEVHSQRVSGFPIPKINDHL